MSTERVLWIWSPYWQDYVKLIGVDESGEPPIRIPYARWEVAPTNDKRWKSAIKDIPDIVDSIDAFLP